MTASLCLAFLLQDNPLERLKKILGDSLASTSRAVSTKRFWRSASESFGFVLAFMMDLRASL
jgi:hypothetical protein